MTANDPFVQAVADEMSDLADRLCRLACILAGDPVVVQTHFDELQSIDLMTQIQRALVELLRQPGTPEARFSKVPVEALAARMKTRFAELCDETV